MPNGFTRFVGNTKNIVITILALALLAVGVWFLFFNDNTAKDGGKGDNNSNANATKKEDSKDSGDSKPGGNSDKVVNPPTVTTTIPGMIKGADGWNYTDADKIVGLDSSKQPIRVHFLLKGTKADRGADCIWVAPGVNEPNVRLKNNSIEARGFALITTDPENIWPEVEVTTDGTNWTQVKAYEERVQYSTEPGHFRFHFLCPGEGTARFVFKTK